jgi:CheY-like chemotaxis protein
VLQYAGHQIIEAANGEQALRAAKTHRPDFRNRPSPTTSCES